MGQGVVGLSLLTSRGSSPIYNFPLQNPQHIPHRARVPALCWTRKDIGTMEGRRREKKRQSQGVRTPGSLVLALFLSSSPSSSSSLPLNTISTASVVMRQSYQQGETAMAGQWAGFSIDSVESRAHPRGRGRSPGGPADLPRRVLRVNF